MTEKKIKEKKAPFFFITLVFYNQFYDKYLYMRIRRLGGFTFLLVIKSNKAFKETINHRFIYAMTMLLQ